MSRFWEWTSLSLFWAMGFVCLVLLVIFRKKTFKEAKNIWHF